MLTLEIASALTIKDGMGISPNILPMLAPTIFSRWCNYDIQYLPPTENLPKFYRDIISHWQKINSTNPETKGDVLNQITKKKQSVHSSKVICRN